MEVSSVQKQQLPATATPSGDVCPSLTSEMRDFFLLEGLSPPPEIEAQLETSWSAVVVWLKSLEKCEKDTQDQYCTHLGIDTVKLLPKTGAVPVDQVCWLIRLSHCGLLTAFVMSGCTALRAIGTGPGRARDARDHALSCRG